MVTTNFDTLFERTQRSAGGNRSFSSVGPGLAAVGSPDFHGIMHLHGRIANARLGLAASNLILTSADFGEAYLRSGWASRFVYDLLRRYTLVFVGYSADDPPMRYMLEATEAGRLHFPDLRRAYAFAPFGEDPGSEEGSVLARWRAKGLVPIVYDNRDRSHDEIYRLLTAWAEFARDPGTWAAGEIARIAAASFEEASEPTRAKVKFLTTTISNTAVLSNCATSPGWVEVLIDKEAPYLSVRDANIWFAQRLGDREAVKWVLGAAPTLKAIVAEAAQMHLAASQNPLPEAMHRFWRLFVVASLARRHEIKPFDRLAARSVGATDYFTVEGVVEIVRPRLQFAAPSPFFAPDGDKLDPGEPILRDLCYPSFKCEEWPSWSELLTRWPRDPEAEYRLLNALGRALAEVCELAREAGLINANGDAASREVQLVHELEPAEAGVPPLAEGFYGGRWQRTDFDELRHSFVPIVRLMSGLWRRLATIDVRRARAIGRSWMEQDFLLFQRLGYWAATISDVGSVDVAAETLGELSHTSFWLDHRSAEAARFWCGRWNTLPRKTRRVIEQHILNGPAFEWISLAGNGKEQEQHAADWTRYRELVRITTAGGILSGRSRALLVRLTACLENPPAQVSVVEGLRQVAWSGWGAPGDTSLVAAVPPERLLERIKEIEASDPINQDGLWVAVSRERSGDALQALVHGGDRGQWPEGRWRGYLNASLMSFKDGVDGGQVGATLRVLDHMPTKILAEILPAATVWLREANAGVAREMILATWDHMLSALPQFWVDAHDRSTVSTQSLFEVSVNHPVGALASILVTLQDRSPKEPAAGLSLDLRPRFEKLTELPGRLKKLAIAPMVQALPFFLRLAPEWTKENLCLEIDQDDSDARELFIYPDFIWKSLLFRPSLESPKVGHLRCIT